MVTSINSSTQAFVLHTLSQTSKKETNQFNKLSSGKSIANPGDNVTGLAKAQSLTATVKGLEIANKQSTQAANLVDTAAGGISQTLESLQSLRELALKGASDTLSPSDQSTLNQQAQSLVSNIGSVAQSVKFDGTNLLDGSYKDKTVQTGATGGESAAISIQSVTPEALGVDTVDLSTPAKATSALTSIDSAISSVTSQLSNLGSKSNSFNSSVSTNQTSSRNIENARSTLEDLDFAKATSQIQTIQIQKKQALQILGQINSSNASTLKLIT